MTDEITLCKHGNPAGECSTCAEHQIYKAATERRKERGIKLKRISLMAEVSQVEAFHELFEVWVERYGKTGAVDVLLKLMAEVEVRIREAEKVDV